MRRCQNHDLTRPDGLNLWADPVEVRKWAHELFDVSGKDSDALHGWSHSPEPADVLAHNSFRKAYLARYGRQSVLQWDDVPVAEVERYFNEVMDIVKREGELSRMSED